MTPRSLIRNTGITSMLGDYFEPWNDWFGDSFNLRSVNVPKVNISEDDTAYNLMLALPGVDKEDLKIDVEGRVLTVSAEKEDEQEQKDEKFTRREYNYSSFARSFTLPDHVLADKIQATYEGGQLKLVVPKTEKEVKDAKKNITVA